MSKEQASIESGKEQKAQCLCLYEVKTEPRSGTKLAHSSLETTKNSTLTVQQKTEITPKAEENLQLYKEETKGEPPTESVQNELQIISSNDLDTKTWFSLTAFHNTSKAQCFCSSEPIKYEPSQYVPPKPLPPLAPPDIVDKLKLGYELLQASGSKSLLRRKLTRDVLDKLKYKVTPNASTLLDVVQSGYDYHFCDVGVYAADRESYDIYAPLLDPIIADYHGTQITQRQPPVDWGDPATISQFVLDTEGKTVKTTSIRVCRSLEGYPFNPQMTPELYKQMESHVLSALATLDGEFAGQYESLAKMTAKRQNKLTVENLIFKEGNIHQISSKGCLYWPTGRGVFMNEKKNFLVWVGDEDHVRIISVQSDGNLGQVYLRLITGVKKLEKVLQFVRHDRLGYLTFCPTNVGTSVRAWAVLKLPKLGKDKEKLQAVANDLRLQVRLEEKPSSGIPEMLFDISNKRRFGLTEFQAVEEAYRGLKEIIQLEQGTRTTIRDTKDGIFSKGKNKR